MLYVIIILTIDCTWSCFTLHDLFHIQQPCDCMVD